ncbi:MAG: alpha/beta hydrolase [Aestuariivita sp.]|nr:alpha/beta hydrolase [Aestuariivita sp.]
MIQPNFLKTERHRHLAYHKTPGHQPTVIFLGGLRSDMTGTKAIHLENWAKGLGQSFLRFDYRGHGASSGEYEDGCIGDWHQDSITVINTLTEGQVILVGSSMGGWQALLIGRRMPERVKGIVTIAAAPDFTEDSYWANFSDDERSQLDIESKIEVPSEYEESYVITKRLIEDGRDHLVLRKPLIFPFPVRCLHGSADTSVKTDVALRLFYHINCPDLRLILAKDADHRFSNNNCLKLIEDAISDIINS